MSGAESKPSGLPQLASELRTGLHKVAAASGEELEERIDRVDAILDRYQGAVEDASGGEGRDDNLRRRVAASRLELEKLRSDDVSRREAVGRIRLMMLSAGGGAGGS